MDHPLPLSRRNFLKTSAALGAAVMNPRPVFPLEFQTFPKVGIERCRRYDYDPVRAALAKLFDGIGDIPALVKGKTVTIKVNLTSYMAEGVYSLSSVETVHTHPVVVLAACSLFQEYGARRSSMRTMLSGSDTRSPPISRSGGRMATVPPGSPTRRLT